MAKMIDRFKQMGDGEVRKKEVPTSTSVTDKKAYSNMMVYLKELKLHNVKNLELAEQIYMLSENSVEKLNEMHEVLIDRISSGNSSEGSGELLKRTELLQGQIRSLADMLRHVYEKQSEESQREQAEYNRYLEDVMEKNQVALENNLENHELTLKNELGRILQSIENQEQNQQKDDEAVKALCESQETFLKNELEAMRKSMEARMEEQHQEILEELSRVKKTTRDYSKVAMWASCLVFILVLLDMLIF